MARNQRFQKVHTSDPEDNVSPGYPPITNGEQGVQTRQRFGQKNFSCVANCKFFSRFPLKDIRTEKFFFYFGIV